MYGEAYNALRAGFVDNDVLSQMSAAQVAVDGAVHGPEYAGRLCATPDQLASFLGLPEMSDVITALTVLAGENVIEMHTVNDVTFVCMPAA